MSSPRIWLITGASSGIGLSMTKTVLDNGDIAIATLRKPSALDGLKVKYPTDKLYIVKLDVTNEDDIAAAFKYAQEKLGRIDIVFNNAGHGMMAEAEGTSHEVAKKMFDVNFWGAMNVSKESVRFFREVNKPQGGRLWNVSSMAGILPVAAFGYYSASKHALEGATEALSVELDPKWNIKITLLEFGAFKTQILQPEATPRFPVHPAYTEPTLAGNVMRNHVVGDTFPLGDCDKATAMLFHKLASDPEPSLRLAVGLDSSNGIKQKLKSIETDIANHESWSEALQ